METATQKGTEALVLAALIATQQGVLNFYLAAGMPLVPLDEVGRDNATLVEAHECLGFLRISVSPKTCGLTEELAVLYRKLRNEVEAFYYGEREQNTTEEKLLAVAVVFDGLLRAHLMPDGMDLALGPVIDANWECAKPLNAAATMLANKAEGPLPLASLYEVLMHLYQAKALIG